ncbi:nSTAND1 domain-containing NTPase [Paractinoplanes lichenicola]|uniref:Novel STAND NTPase 1 domain-containing protein n=1 Tax=Paractinoplanes lichenicola TaxID=2802976 RepID=A0ABS1VV34_9ACTN|nr:hypothetical protein [Actinoplanes lichenicola]MBL7258341.1 hypothetical protein [Actinoplanes lichenicola]
MDHPSPTRPIPPRAPTAYGGRIERDPRELSTLFVGLFFGFAINILTAETDWLWSPLTAYPWIWVPISVGAWFLWRWWRRRRSAITWKGDDNPYPGLAAFEEDRAEVFFGRAQESWEILRRLDRSGLARQQRFVALVGPSGSGKSSLLRAGVLPRLPKRWRVIGPMQPGPEVFRDLRAACGGEELLGHLAGVGGRVVLVIDQLEDLFTQSRPDERGPFLDVLHEALAARRELHVVVTMRPEFLAAAGALKPGLFDQPIPIAALDPRHMRDAIERPAAAAGVTFEPRLVDLMLAEATVGDALPLLGHLLQRLYTESDRGVITIARYDAAGRVGGAITEHADAVYAGLITSYPASVVDATLLRLVGVEDDEPVRRAVSRASLSGDEAGVMAELRRARLLADRGAGGEVVLAHDSLFRQWRLLTELIDDHRPELAEMTLLERRAVVWTASGDRADLLPGPALARAESAVDGLAVSPVMRQFLEASALERARVNEDLARDIIEQVVDDEDVDLLAAVVATAMRERAPTRIGQLVLWSLKAEAARSAMRVGHRDLAFGLACLTDGRLRTCDDQGKVCTWDDDGRLTDVRWAGRATCCDTLLSPDGRLVLRDGAVWHAETSRRIAEVSGNPKAFPANDQFEIETGPGRFARYRIDGSELTLTRTAVNSRATALTWSLDGDRLAAVVNHTPSGGAFGVSASTMVARPGPVRPRRAVVARRRPAGRL